MIRWQPKRQTINDVVVYLALIVVGVGFVVSFILIGWHIGG